MRRQRSLKRMHWIHRTSGHRHGTLVVVVHDAPNVESVAGVLPNHILSHAPVFTGFSVASTMNGLPTEIWSKICFEACMDGGYTGKTLSQTCSFFRQVSKPFKLRSVALFGPDAIVSFLKLVETLPQNERSVEYLYALDVTQASLEDPEADHDCIPESFHDVVDYDHDEREFKPEKVGPKLLYVYMLTLNRRKYTSGGIK